MTIDERQIPVLSEIDMPWSRVGMAAPPWYLRWKLTWVMGDIDEIERRLGDEFGLAETAPLNAEHIALIEERDALMGRLTNPVAETAH